MRVLFDWLHQRGAGILLHPTSLPDNQGIGVLGNCASQWLDFLSQARINYWQVLPLGPTGFGDSPYQGFSSAAGNPFLIDLEMFLQHALLRPEELKPIQNLPADRVDFGRIFQIKWPLLRLAWTRFQQRELAYLPNFGLWETFKQDQSAWLRPYAEFMTLKNVFGGKSCQEWPENWRNRRSALMHEEEFKELEEEIQFHSWTQYVFFGQWTLLRAKAKRLGIQIIGDLPLYVAPDSVEVWSHPEVFQIDANGLPLAVAGLPPDYYSSIGQLWGNPLYNWEMLRKQKYAWWHGRLARSLDMFDIVRLDHFRGFYNYWSIPAEQDDARAGAWQMGPGLSLFKSIRKRYPEARLIAEDLVEIGPEVRELLAQTGLPGMAVLQFAFDGDCNNPYLPHNLPRNCAVYPGTHDNDTVSGWYENTPQYVKDQVRRYFRVNGDDIAWDLIRACYRSASRLAIIPIQDLMGLGSRARMNMPGAAKGNWNWRLTAEQMEWQRGTSAYLAELAWLYGR